jgi:hypothetical protein
MRYTPDKASGPWPCYTIDFDELVAIAAAQGIGTESDGVPVTPKADVIEGVIDALRDERP